MVGYFLRTIERQTEGRSVMRTSSALLLAAVFAMYPFGGVAGEKKIADIK